MRLHSVVLKDIFRRKNKLAIAILGVIVVRSNVCPPCGSIGFSLDNDILICDSCRTTFDAGSGQGTQGACVDYPKESIPFTVSDGNIVMEMDDIVIAHTNTIHRG